MSEANLGHGGPRLPYYSAVIGPPIQLVETGPFWSPLVETDTLWLPLFDTGPLGLPLVATV